MKMIVFFSENFDRFKWKYLFVTPVANDEAAWKAVSEKTGWSVADLQAVIKIWLRLDLPATGKVVVVEAQPAS